MEKNDRISLAIIGILNIISGFLNLILIFMLSIFGFIAGILYFIFAFAVFKKSFYKFKWMFYLFIIPLTIIHWPSFIMMGTKAAPPGYKMNLIGQIIFIAMPLITCLGNIYLLNHPKLKEQFK